MYKEAFSYNPNIQGDEEIQKEIYYGHNRKCVWNTNKRKDYLMWGNEFSGAHISSPYLAPGLVAPVSVLAKPVPLRHLYQMATL